MTLVSFILFSKRFIYFHFLHVVLWPHICICTTCMPGVLGGQKRALDPLQLELQTAVSHNVGAGNKIWILWMSKEYSEPQSHLSNLSDPIFYEGDQASECSVGNARVRLFMDIWFGFRPWVWILASSWWHSTYSSKSDAVQLILILPCGLCLWVCIKDIFVSPEVINTSPLSFVHLDLWRCFYGSMPGENLCKGLIW